jgi:hypothetical protein
MTGGNLGKGDFTEIPQKGAVLIGMEVCQPEGIAHPDKKFVSYYRGIYLTSRGEVLGRAVGTPRGDPVVLRAKHGYAVGAITARGGGALDAVTVTFMKIRGIKLKADDSYSSDRLGGYGGEEERDYNGNGVPIIGLVGKADPKWIGVGVVFMSRVKDAPNKSDSP